MTKPTVVAIIVHTDGKREKPVDIPYASLSREVAAARRHVTAGTFKKVEFKVLVT